MIRWSRKKTKILSLWSVSEALFCWFYSVDQSSSCRDKRKLFEFYKTKNIKTIEKNVEKLYNDLKIYIYSKNTI